MESLINPNFAYLLIIAAVLLAIASILFPRSTWLKIGMLFSLGAAGFELFHLNANPWALLAAALSPLLFFFATRQENLRKPLLILTVVTLLFGAVFLFMDKNGRPTVSPALPPLISIFCAEFLWIASKRLSAQGARRGEDPNSYIGLVGTAYTDIEDVGMVQVEGETLPARSEQMIPAGSQVRVIKNEGRLLVVKKVEMPGKK